MISIGDLAFYDCKSLTSITIPHSVTSIGGGAFGGCQNIQKLVVKNPNCKFGKYVFGREFPPKLLNTADTLLPYFSDSDVKTYLLFEKAWNIMNAATQANIFLQRQGKSLQQEYAKCITNGNQLAEVLLDRISAKLSVKECNALATFMTIFSQNVSPELVCRLYDALKPLKTAAKAIKAIENDPVLMASLSSSAIVQSPIEKKMAEILREKKISAQLPEINLKEYYNITTSDIPEVKCSDGTIAPPFVMAWLLTTHEKKIDSWLTKIDVTDGHEKPGLRPEAEEIVAELDNTSFQNCLRKLAVENLGLVGHTKKMYLAYPICRYADETLMAELTKRAPSWRSSASGNEAPPFASFRSANVYSNTRSAMFFAEKYGSLRTYAHIRGMTEDAIRDQFLSNVGIDENGGKSYDLGNQTVTARLQADLSYLIELPSGETAKSLPKKGADETKYAAANADFSEMKKLTKKIVKSRGDALVNDFLSGRTRKAKDWCVSYLHNPLLRSVAELLVWSQGQNTFTLKNGQPISSAEQLYTIDNKPIAVAHPMEMSAETVTAWQKYFAKQGIKQPFVQIWEPVIHPANIREDRYENVMIPYYRFLKQEKHGIYVTDEDFHNEIYIRFDDCDANVERIDYERHNIEPTHRFEVTTFIFKKYTRRTNHVVGLLDKWTAYGRVLNDDASITEMLPQFTLAQIMDFIKLANDNNCANCTAALLEYKNANFADYDPIEEFSLDW